MLHSAQYPCSQGTTNLLGSSTEHNMCPCKVLLCLKAESKGRLFFNCPQSFHNFKTAQIKIFNMNNEFELMINIVKIFARRLRKHRAVSQIHVPSTELFSDFQLSVLVHSRCCHEPRFPARAGSCFQWKVPVLIAAPHFDLVFALSIRFSVRVISFYQ